MSAENEKPSAQRRLTSWKEIAAYVGRDERTVKRWEAARGLPVRRIPGATHGSVFAYADEIEAWLHGRAVPANNGHAAAPRIETAPGSRRRSKWPLPAAALAGVAVVIGALAWWRYGSPAVPAPLHTHDAVAASLYSSGLHAWQTRTPSGLRRAIDDFKQAIVRDRHFAEAWVGLADAYNLEGEFTAAPRDRDYAQAAIAAREAVALGPSLAGAHAALAFSDFYGARDLHAAEAEFQRAVTLDPRSAVAHHWYATFLMTIGDDNAALSEIGKAESLDAESAAIPADKALILFYAGRKAEAVRLLTQLEEDNPGFASPHFYLASIALAGGDDKTYVRELALLAATRHDKVGTAVADAATRGLAGAGHDGMLRALFAVQRRFFDSKQVTAYALAATCAMLSDETCAKSWLTRSFARHEAENISLAIDPPFARFHKSAWFTALLAQAGLPPLAAAPDPLHTRQSL